MKKPDGAVAVGWSDEDPRTLLVKMADGRIIGSREYHWECGLSGLPLLRRFNATGHDMTDDQQKEHFRKTIRALPGYPWLPCPICNGTESCDHIAAERAQAALPWLVLEPSADQPALPS